MKHVSLWKIFAIAGLVFLAACAGQPASVTQPAAGNPAVIEAQPTTASTAAAIPVTSTEGAATPSAVVDPTQALPTAAQAVQPTVAAQPTVVAQPTAAGQPKTFDCTSPAALTVAMTEGPYFKAGSPESKDLAGSLPGMKLHLSGYVLTADCQPVANAKIDFWQADSQGRYDNNGYTLRGYQLTGADGSYQLTTVVPGLYPGRTEHIHVKVQAPGGPVLTTQLFFPGVAQNQSDGIYNQSLLVKVLSADGEMTATYNFVVAVK